ncbi:MAG TPA: methionine biosynthesis protein MetW [Thermodesulfovibrionia bacterium]|nr:methionine biosynthesis protein MetW [Thermodesulfovibrionia bacterium]
MDHKVIYSILKPRSKVLDLGCGDCELLYWPVKKKGIIAQGIELNEEAIYKCVEKGISVLHGDIESGLEGFPDKSFDYVILNQSMQETKNVSFIMDEAIRVGKKVIVGFPNFAHFNARLMLFFHGKAPILPSLPFKWYDTPNLHFLSITDFKDFCEEKQIKILKAYYLSKNRLIKFLPNLFAIHAIFLLQR